MRLRAKAAQKRSELKQFLQHEAPGGFALDGIPIAGFPRKTFPVENNAKVKPEATNLKFDVLEIGTRQSYQCWVEYLSDL